MGEADAEEEADGEEEPDAEEEAEAEEEEAAKVGCCWCIRGSESVPSLQKLSKQARTETALATATELVPPLQQAMQLIKGEEEKTEEEEKQVEEDDQEEGKDESEKVGEGEDEDKA